MNAVAEAHVDLSAYLRDCRRLALDEIRRIVPRDDQRASGLYELMLDYPMRDAKGLRPALCIATCRALGGGLEAVIPSAAVLELYHNAFLIHDDVEDGSEQRRDRPALHREHGAAIAMNVGDGMLALALGPLLENTRTVGLGKALKILQVIARMARETAEGQAIELAWIRNNTWELDDEDYRAMVVKKTGWYSFIAPMMIGAIVAGHVSEERSAALTLAARELAIAFQIRDDVLNLKVAPAYGKETNGDLWEGKRTAILLHMLRAVTATQRAHAIAVLSRPRHANWSPLIAELANANDLTPRGREKLERALDTVPGKTATDVDQLAAWIAEHGSLAYASNVARAHALRASAALAQAGLSPSVHRDVLDALINFTIDRES